MNRRSFLKSTGAVLTCGVASGTCYGFAEAAGFEITRRTVTVPNLPSRFVGLKIAFLTDIHHGPYTPLSLVVNAVRATLSLCPDLIVLGGDYTHRDEKFIRPCFDVLKSLSAPLGVFGVLGNHDYANGERATRSAMRDAKVEELTNGGEWLSRGTDRLRLAGVDDFWWGKPDVGQAVGKLPVGTNALLVSHNPDFCETINDRRVGLVLSGHTHGGQLRLPGIVNPFIPSRYGDKYSQGLVEAPRCRVYVSRGLGTIGLPIRLNCPPELTLLTLTDTSVS